MGASVRHAGWVHVQWDAATLGDWVAALDGVDVVVHLAGKRVDCRPTKANIDELIRSRVESVRLVGEAIKLVDKPPSAWVQLSSLAIFADSGDTIIDESSVVPTTGPRQQVEVCRQWEAAFEDATIGFRRTVLLRPGIAVGGDGDRASRHLGLLARFGLGGQVGSGAQWVSWIGGEDFFDVLHRAVTDETMSGLYHVTSPVPVQNRDLMGAYRRAVGCRIGFGAPRVLTTIGAWLLGSDPGLALTGRRCIPARLMADGHQFKVTEIDRAVAISIKGH